MLKLYHQINIVMSSDVICKASDQFLLNLLLPWSEISSAIAITLQNRRLFNSYLSVRNIPAVSILGWVDDRRTRSHLQRQGILFVCGCATDRMYTNWSAWMRWCVCAVFLTCRYFSFPGIICPATFATSLTIDTTVTAGSHHLSTLYSIM